MQRNSRFACTNMDQRGLLSTTIHTHTHTHTHTNTHTHTHTYIYIYKNAEEFKIRMYQYGSKRALLSYTHTHTYIHTHTHLCREIQDSNVPIWIKGGFLVLPYTHTHTHTHTHTSMQRKSRFACANMDQRGLLSVACVKTCKCRVQVA